MKYCDFRLCNLTMDDTQQYCVDHKCLICNNQRCYETLYCDNHLCTHSSYCVNNALVNYDLNDIIYVYNMVSNDNIEYYLIKEYITHINEKDYEFNFNDKLPNIIYLIVDTYNNEYKNFCIHHLITVIKNMLLDIEYIDV